MIKEYINIMGKENVEKALKTIAQKILDEVEYICNDNDLEDVHSITIHAELIAGEVANFDITKNYLATINKNEEE